MSKAAPSRAALRLAQQEPCSPRFSFIPCAAMASSAAWSRSASVAARELRWLDFEGDATCRSPGFIFWKDATTTLASASYQKRSSKG